MSGKVIPAFNVFPDVAISGYSVWAQFSRKTQMTKGKNENAHQKSVEEWKKGQRENSVTSGYL